MSGNMEKSGGIGENCGKSGKICENKGKSGKTRENQAKSGLINHLLCKRSGRNDLKSQFHP